MGLEGASATISLVDDNDVVQSTNTATPQITSHGTTALAKLDTIVKLPVGTNGETWTPWFKVAAQSDVFGGSNGRYDVPVSAGSYGDTRTYWRRGVMAQAGVFNPTFSTLSPDPGHLALDDGSTRTDPLNQYTIDVGIPTSVTVTSSDPVFNESLRANSSWNITGTAPALRPFLDNTKEEANGTATIRPQHPGLDGSPTPENGLKFDVQTSASPSTTSNVGWNFPTDNDKFGVKTLNHVVSGTTIPAPVALFFPNSGFQHPDGGPIGYSRLYGATVVGEKTPTPNWFYYYDTLFENPWNIETHYLHQIGSTSYGLSGVVFVGDEAHGEMVRPFTGSIYSRPTYIFGRIPSSSPEDDPSLLTCVGEEFVRGLDVYT